MAESITSQRRVFLSPGHKGWTEIKKYGKICIRKSGFVERFPELSLFYRLFSPLDSEMICIFPYFCPYAEFAREIREFFI